MAYERKNIQAMNAYTPGEQPDAARVIKLNTNENPFPPGPAVLAALASVEAGSLRRYPPPAAGGLRDCIAGLHGIDSSKVIVTNGGDELLRLAITTFVEPDEAIAVLEPTYTLYETLASAHGCGFIRLQLEADWSLPANLAESLNQRQAKMCLLPNPHAPSGRLTSSDSLRELAGNFKGVLLIDEAYVDFVDPQLQHSCLSLLSDFDNVLLLRTFSKGYSLAGLRIAYGLGAETLIAPLYKTKDSYNTDFIAQKLAQAALEDQAYARESWNFVIAQRAWLQDELDMMGFSCEPSQSNFLLVSMPENLQAKTLYQQLKDRDILVRYFAQPRLEDKLRISVGSAEENQTLIQTIRHLLAT